MEGILFLCGFFALVCFVGYLGSRRNKKLVGQGQIMNRRSRVLQK